MTPRTGDRWGIGIVAALPTLIVALAIPLVIEGTLVGLLYAPLVLAVAITTIGWGAPPGVLAVFLGTVVGGIAGAFGNDGTPIWVPGVLVLVLLLATWGTELLAMGPRPAWAAVPGVALVLGVLITGVAGTLEAGVLAGLVAVSIALLLILAGPWAGQGAVNPARWAEVLAIAVVAVVGFVTVGLAGGVDLGEPARVNLFGQTSEEVIPEGSPPDPFLLAARWQLEPDQATTTLFTVVAGPAAPRNRPVWASFSTYNGIAWLEPPTYGVSGQEISADPEATAARTEPGSTRVEITVALPGQWVPTPQRVTQVLGSTATRVDPVTGIVTSLSSPASQTFDLRYAVPVAGARTIAEAEPSRRPGLDPSVLLPGPLPAPMAELADEIADATDVPTERLDLLAETLRGERFRSATGADLAGGPPDRSYAGLSTVLAEGVGFQEQYAAIWALIARSWGISTRLVIGFLPPGVADAQDTATRPVLAPDVSIWAEARMAGLGWLSYQPSPQDRDAGRPAFVRPIRPQDQPEPTPSPSPTAAPTPQDPDAGGAAGTLREAAASVPWRVVIPVVLLVALIAWVGYVAWTRRRLRASLLDGDARVAVAGAWAWTRLLLAEAWMPLPPSRAPDLAADPPQDLPDAVAAAVVEVERYCAPWRYGPDTPPADAAVEAWRLADQVGVAIGRVTGWRSVARRWLVPLRPEAPAAVTSLLS